MTLPDLSTPGVYAGIGSRSTPADVLSLMGRIATELARLGWVLRSGAAPGADTAFEDSALRGGGRIHLYLPWPGFEGRVSSVRLERPTAKAVEIAATHHPGWRNLLPPARALMGRNSHQILGASCNDPVSFVLCWTPDGATTAAETSAMTGGTGQAIRVASVARIPIYNLQLRDCMSEWERWLDGACGRASRG